MVYFEHKNSSECDRYDAPVLNIIGFPLLYAPMQIKVRVWATVMALVRTRVRVRARVRDRVRLRARAGVMASFISD